MYSYRSTKNFLLMSIYCYCVLPSQEYMISILQFLITIKVTSELCPNLKPLSSQLMSALNPKLPQNIIYLQPIISNVYHNSINFAIRNTSFSIYTYDIPCLYICMSASDLFQTRYTNVTAYKQSINPMLFQFRRYTVQMYQ